MFTKTQIGRYADVLLWGLETARTENFHKGDIVSVNFDLAAMKLAESLHARLLDRGMNPVMRLVLTSVMEHNLFRHGSMEQIVFIPPGEEELTNNLNGTIHLRAPASITHLKDIDPGAIGKRLVSRKPLRDILNRREETGLYGWTLCTFTTEELAKKAGITVRQYSNQIIRACYLDKPDPVREWQSIHENATSIKEWLNSMRVNRFHVESVHVDLYIVPGERRKWAGVSGHNIPSFELFISPDWRGTEGIYYANQPSFRSGNYVEDVRLTFVKGKAVRVTAKKGKRFLIKQLALDQGAARVGEFSLTDKRFSRINRFMADTLFDENFGGRYGNCHIAVGASYSDTYNGNPEDLTGEMKEKLGFNDSALHWDLVNTEKKRVTAFLAGGGKQVVYENGIFLY